MWFRHMRYLRFMVVLITGLTLLAGCGGDKSKEAEPRNNFGNVSPVNRADVPPGVEEVSISIKGGKIETETLTFQQNEPSVLHVENADTSSYQIRITPDLVTDTDVAPSKTTDIKFTTPNANRYELQLRLAGSTGDPIDTLDVIVQSAGGVKP